MKTYQICLTDLDRRRVVIIGGGAVAARKVRTLLTVGAHPIVISPIIIGEIETLAHSGDITLIRRSYQKGDLTDAFLVIAATDIQAINHAVWEEANQRGCLINVADDPEYCNFFLPALVQRDDLSIAISTGGASPAMARRLREKLDTIIGPEYGVLADLMAEFRPDLLSQYAPGEARLAAALSVIDSDILEIIKNDGREAARRYAAERLSTENTDEHI